jgi:hypothetical protein
MQKSLVDLRNTRESLAHFHQSETISTSIGEYPGDELAEVRLPELVYLQIRTPTLYLIQKQKPDPFIYSYLICYQNQKRSGPRRRNTKLDP